jgi:hypothetical protein
MTLDGQGVPSGALAASPGSTIARTIAHAAGHGVYFTTAADLATKLHEAALDGRWQAMMKRFGRPRLLLSMNWVICRCPLTAPQPSSRSSTSVV